MFRLFLTIINSLLLLNASFVTAWLPTENPPDSFLHTNSTSSSSSKRRWLPSVSKIRGVNLGSQFLVEPWMAWDEWQSMGCGNAVSEFDCVSAIGQTAANSAWGKHWSTWITKDDFTQMASYGLNTVRIGVGYWIREDLVYQNSEYFPQGGLAYLTEIVGWASDAGFYIIMDLHGAPGAQVAENADTGQYAPTAGFYTATQFERTYKFLEWMTKIIHTNTNYRNVGMIEVVNEPQSISTSAANALYLRKTFYPTAWKRIRAMEKTLQVTSSNLLHILMMNELWGSGDPKQYLPSTTFAAYDDHRYLKWSSDGALATSQSQAAYLSVSCADNRNSDNEHPTIVGEFSLGIADSVEWSTPFNPTNSSNIPFYQKWFAAQIKAYERSTRGWVFWSWKTNWLGGVNDWRWSYQAAVTAGVIGTDLNKVVASHPCK